MFLPVYKVMGSYTHTFYVNVNSDPEFTPWLSLSTETGTHCAKCAAALTVEMAQVQFLDNLLTRYVQRQVLWSRCSLGQGVHARCFCQTGALLVQTAQKTVELPQLQFRRLC